MNKIITALTLLVVSSQLFSVSGQRISRLPQKNIKSIEMPTKNIESIEVPTTKTPTVSGISTAEAFSDGNGVLVKWQTESENDLIGFNIYRTNGKENVKLNESLITSTNIRNTPAARFGSQYKFFDENGGFQDSYVIENVFGKAGKTTFNPIAPQYTSDLKNVSTLSSEQFRQAKISAQPEIDISEPFIKTGSKLQRKVSRAAADLDTQKWIASQPGVKFAITKEGFYRVSRAQLETAGFDVNSAVGNWQLYFNGVEQAILTEPSGQYIEFYGAPPEDGLESATATYYLLAGSSAGRRMDMRIVRPVGGTIPATTFYQSQFRKQRHNYTPNVLNGDAGNFFGNAVTEDPVNVNFTLRALDYSIRKTEMFVTIQGASLHPHRTRIEVNGEDMGELTGVDRESMTAYITIPTQFLVEGTNTLRLTALGGNNEYSFFDKVEVRVQRKYIADNNQLSFYTNDFRSCDIYGFSSPDIRIFDVTNEGRPTVLTNYTVFQQDGTNVATIPAFETRKLYSLVNEAIKQVDSVTPNVPSTISTPGHSPQFVIISHKNFMNEANTWANYRRSQGMTVEVFDIEDIFDEFNFGKLGWIALRNFAAYAKNEWNTPPGYIMLVGDATYDPRNYFGLGNNNFIPTKMIDTIYTETGSDDTLTDLNNDGLAEIPIGRLPVRNAAEVTHLFNKVTNFEQTVAQGLDRGVLCASDLPEGYDFAALCVRVMNELPESVAKTYVNRGEPNSGTLLLNQMNTGKFFVNYSGHGHVSTWATSTFFGNATANSLANSNLSIFTMLTCLNGYFVEVDSNSLSETLLSAQNGAVITWSSTGLTTPDIQEVMARRFYHQVSFGNMTRIGDLANDAKSVINSGRDVRLSWVLLGDPTLKVKP